MQGTTTLALTLSPLLAYAATHSVAVGQSGLTFSPNNIKAAVGDKVDFHFFPKNHSVVASSFAKPCVPIQPDGGIFSGFVPTATESPDVFEVTVNDTKPIWIFCAQAKHCQSGMSMVINEPSGPNSLAAYQEAAKSVPASLTPPSLNGGIFLSATKATSGGSGNATAGGNGNGNYTSSPYPGASGTAAPSAGESYQGAAAIVRAGSLAAAVGVLVALLV